MRARKNPVTGTWNLPALFAFFLFLCALAPASANAADLKGSKDSPLLPRYEGSSIVTYSQKEYDSLVVPLGKTVYQDEKYKFTKSETVEGRVTRILYLAPAGRSALEVFRNYEQVLKNKGYVPLFSCAKGECGPYDSFAETLYGRAQAYPIPGDEGTKNQQFLAARLSRPEGDVVVTVCAFDNTFWGSEVKMEKNRAYCRVDIVELKGMQSKMVVVKADEMTEKIRVSGRVALYSLLFDTDKAELRAESKPTLAEIAKMLKAQPKMRLLVVGHTDSVGEREYNMGLSKRRAESVVKSLVSSYGIAANRLVPAGVGMLAPVATNQTEEGRAKNRRVELVEF